jgi:hypothetical protein
VVPDLSQALGFVSVGVGIVSATLAPILLRDGVLQFISSGDARAQSKFGRSHKEWEIQQERFLCSRQPESGFEPQPLSPRNRHLRTGYWNRWAARNSVWEEWKVLWHGIPMPVIAALARYQLRVRGKTVVSSQELRDSDDILVGRTALKFVSRKEK